MKICPVEVRIDTPDVAPIPMIQGRLACGFPIPTEAVVESHLDLAGYLIKRPAATYFARAEGDSLVGKGICDGALLIIDRSVIPRQGSIVVACVNAEYTCKILDIENRQLLSANPEFPAIKLPDQADLVIEGVVIHAVNHYDWG